jgi:hypothetical protein
MLTLTIWWTGILVEFLILLRGMKIRVVGKFPFFYAYVASVLCADLFLYVLYVLRPSVYPIWSARAELVNIVFGYSIVLEIFRHVLSRYPGAERFARVAGLVVFALILCYAVISPAGGPGSLDPHSRKVVIERDFLTVQAIFLFGTLGVVSYYGLEVGRNIRGMIVGYGVWLGASVITLELRSYIGTSFNTAWIFIQPFSYLFSLVVWLTAFWSYSPVLDSSPIRLETDYESFVSTTRGIIGELRSHLGRAARP